MGKILFLVVLGLLPLFVLAYNLPGQPTGFVNDFSQVLSSNQKLALEKKLADFEKETSSEIVVAIIPSLGGDTVENFAVKLFEDWGIGKKGKDNGVLILIAMQDRQMRIEVGYGLEGYLTDLQSHWIIDKIMKPAFQKGDYYQGIEAAIEKIMAATKGEKIPEEKPGVPGSTDQGWLWLKSLPSDFFRFGLVVGMFIIWLISGLITWLASILARSKSWWLGGVVAGAIGFFISLMAGFFFVGLVSFLILIPLGLWFDFVVSRVYQESKGKKSKIPWWAGGGGFDRRSGGGGGGGFGGFGGGGSGGGGASGRW